MNLALKSIVCALVALAAARTVLAQEDPTAITVFTAKKVVTMDPTRPTATAVAVRDGMILGVGSMQDLGPWLRGKPYQVDAQFKNKVLMPGLIDPHMHPMLGAIAFQTVWITPEPWNVMGHKTPATIGEKAYRAALKTAFDERKKRRADLYDLGI